MKNIPEPSLRRLPLYLQYLKKMETTEVTSISSTRISEDLNLTSIQVRKDIAYTGIVGKPKYGYDIKQLIQTIESFLGWRNKSDAFLVGAGNLGSALLGYAGFEENGLNIIAAFDADPEKIGKPVHGKQVLDISTFENLAQRMKIRIGILTVPGVAAQDIADLMVRCGIKAIWNFSPAHIQVPEAVHVQHVNLASSMALLMREI